MKKTTIFSDINKADVISFDVFDTLITRPFVKPRDLLLLVAVEVCKKYQLGLHPDKYVALRMLCEKQAREQSGAEDITLDDVYMLFQKMLFIDQELANKLMLEEIRSELDYSEQREEMFEVYEYAKKKNKKIFFVSDMYLRASDIISLLIKNGYDANSENTIVSSEFGLTKHSGALFDILKEKAIESAKSSNIIHIGDNYTSDIKGARSKELKAYFCENFHDEFLKIPDIKNIFKDNISGRSSKLGISLMLGLASKKFMKGLHPSNFYSRNSLFDGHAYNLGYLGVGIFLLNYSTWLISYAKKNKISKLIFLARDGYLLNEIYKIVANVIPDSPPSEYFLSSRRMFSIPSIFEKKDLNVIFNNNYEGSVEDFIKFRLGIEVDEEVLNKLNFLGISLESNISTLDNIALVRSLVDELSDLILKTAKIEREALKKYVLGKGFLKDSCALGKSCKTLRNVWYMSACNGILTGHEAKQP